MATQSNTGSAQETPMKASSPARAQMSLPSKLAVGAVAGVVGTSMIFPIDMVKTRLQSQAKSQGKGPRFTGPINCFNTILRREGIRGLYRGLGANLVGVTPEKAIKLAVNDSLRDQWTDANGRISFFHEISAGGLAGFAQVVATNPMEIVKIRLQMQGQKAAASSAGVGSNGSISMPAPRPSALDVARGLGIRGLFRGAPATLLRDVPFSILFFPTYANLRTALGSAYLRHRDGPAAKVSPENIPTGITLLSGVVAGAIASGFVTPADAIKTRLQVVGARRKYSGVVDCFLKVYQEGGIRALYAGATPRMAVVAPLFGISLLAFEVQKVYLRRFADL